MPYFITHPVDGVVSGPYRHKPWGMLRGAEDVVRLDATPAGCGPPRRPARAPSELYPLPSVFLRQARSVKHHPKTPEHWLWFMVANLKGWHAALTGGTQPSAE